MLNLLGAILMMGMALQSAICFGAESNPPWEFQGPNGKIVNTLNLFTQRIRGLPTYQNRTDLEFEGSVSNTEYTFKLVPWSWVRVLDSQGGLNRQARAFFELKEGWGERNSPLWDIRIGNQILAWGAADQINPTDVWNPLDFYDPFLSFKLPIFAVRARLHPPTIENWNFELIATPFFRQSRLPIALPNEGSNPVPVSLDSSRWLLPVPSIVQTDTLTSPLLYQITPATYPMTWQIGGRIQATRLGGWDFSLMGFYGVENMPRFAFTKRGSTIDPSLPVTITLYPSFHRQIMIGADGAGSISAWGEDFGTRFEAGYYLRDNSRAYGAPLEFQSDLLRDDYLHAVLGVDHTFKRNILGTVLYFNLQFIFYQRIGDVESTPGQFVVQGLPRTIPWDRDLVLYLEDRIGSDWKFTTQGIFSFLNHDGIVTPGVHRQWSDHFKTSLTADIFYGSSLGFFGQVRDNKRVNLVASYVF